jgi:hypothetical protein
LPGEAENVEVNSAEFDGMKVVELTVVYGVWIMTVSDGPVPGIVAVDAIPDVM